MSKEDQKNPGGSPGDEGQKPEGQEPEGVKTYDEDYVSKLRNENAKHRIEKQEAKAKNEELLSKLQEYEDLKKKAAEEQGKFKELYETASQEIEKLKTLEAKVQKYDEVTTKQLDDVLKSLTEREKSLYDELPEMSVIDRLEWAKKLKATGAGQNSPASERAGGGTALDEQEWRKIIEDKNKMIELSVTDRPFYDKLIQFKRKILKE